MGNSKHRYKVSRIAKKYEIQNAKEDLIKLWTQDDPVSLRDLATYFNEQVLQAAMENEGMNTLDGEVENIYQLLASDEISKGIQTETQRKLERNGINVEELQSDFVTYQAVRTYLQKGCDLEYEQQTDAERIENVIQSIGQLQNRTATVTEEKLSQLNKTDRIELGEFRIFLDLRIFCEECSTQYDVQEVLEQKGCKCIDRSSTMG